MIQSFSGAHPFRPRCLGTALGGDLDQLEDFVSIIDRGQCPRCEVNSLPSRPAWPAGSRVTDCRCVPICGDCGSAETRWFLAPSDWPLDWIELKRQYRYVIWIRDNARPVRVDTVLSGAPVSGWRKYGYEDRDDIAERGGR